MKYFFKKWQKSSRHKNLAKVFDHHYYAVICGESVNPTTAMEHFLDAGERRLLSPSPLFDPLWYRHVTGQDTESTIVLLQHYFTNHQRYDPHPLLESRYLQKYVGKVEQNSLVDYVSHARKTANSEDVIRSSPFFCPRFYARQNSDVAKAKIDPLTHYLTYGWRERRSPSPYFDVKWYLSRYTDVDAASVEPLQHFLIAGMEEGRHPHYLIDLEFYLYGAPDVRRSGENPLRHFIEFGDREGRSPHPLFNPFYYCAMRTGSSSEGPFAHYVEHGVRQRVSPCPAFDANYYVWHYPHEAEDPLRSFLLAPGNERPHYHPLIDGNYQQMTSRNCAMGVNSLLDYVQFRSHFSNENVNRGATTIPRPTPVNIRRGGVASAAISSDIKFSIIIPCYKSNLTYLNACIASVVAQTYYNWELILVDDGSPDDTTWRTLQYHESQDERIRAIKLVNNRGISGATNAAIEYAKGEYFVFIDHDDIVTSDALTEMLNAIKAGDADAAYSDQAFIGTNNVIESPNYKPDWSPTLFAGVMYVGHLLIVRAPIARQAGLFKSEFDGCQDFEFMLRVGEQTKKIIHIPKVLYYWRRSEGSIASDSNAKGRIEDKQARAVQDHFQRTSFPGRAVADDRVPHRLRLYPKLNHEFASIDVITQGPLTSSSAHIRMKMNNAGARLREFSVVDWKKSPANCFSCGSAPWVLFFDHTVDLIDPNWLRHRLMHASQADVCFVDSHLYRPDGTILAAGLVTTTTYGPREAYAGFRDGEDGTWGTLFCDREVSSLSGTCTLVARDRLDLIGGLSPSFVSIEGAVKDASYRATQAQLRNISISVRQIEAARPGKIKSLSSEIDQQIFIDKYEKDTKNSDPYYNINFAPDSTNFR